MIRFLMLVLLVVVVAVTGTLLLLKDPGYVLLSYGGYAVETTLSFVFLAGLVTVVLLLTGARCVAMNLVPYLLGAGAPSTDPGRP